MPLLQQRMAVHPEPCLHATPEQPRQAVEKPAQQRGALAETAFENDVDGKLLKAVEGLAHASSAEHLHPTLSAVVTIVRAPGESAAASIAAATPSGFSLVRQQIVEPDPLNQPPNAPALSPAAITFGRKGISGSRCG
jgi:hypothetical protein